MQPSLTDLITTYRRLSAGVLNYDAFDAMIHTHHSTAIEGSSLTLEETQTLIEKGLTAAGKPLVDHLMALDHQQAMRYVLDLASAKTPLTMPIIQHIGGLVMRQTGGQVNTILGSYDTAKGDLRKSGVSAGSRIFMDQAKVPAKLTGLLKEINAAIHEVKTPKAIYDLSFITHFQFVNIHPFGDGNGRTSRLLMNYVQQFHQLPLSLVQGKDRTGYVQALEAARSQENTQPLLVFMTDQLTQFLQQEIQRLQPTIKEVPRRRGGLSLIF